MSLEDHLAAELPPPRDDEPESLRQDVIDELSDHLHCAMQRERLASGGRQSRDGFAEQSTYARVLARFGNPAALARTLWFDAMKERLMPQRFTAVMAGITAATTVLIAMFLWRAVDQQAEALTAASRSNAALLERMITALEDRSVPSSDAVAASDVGRELRQLKLRLAMDEPDGSPAAGYGLKVLGVSDDPELVRVVDSQTDAEGRATLSMNRIGVFYLGIETPAGESASTLIPMGPMHPAEVELVVPSPRRPVEDVAIKIPCPERLQGQEFVYEVTLEARTRTVHGLEWFDDMSKSNMPWINDLRLLVDQDGQIIGRIIETETRDPDDSEQISAPNYRGDREDLLVIQKTMPWKLAAGDYSVLSVAAFRRLDGDANQTPDRLVGPTRISYTFAGGALQQSVAVDTTTWSITLPDFVWQRQTDESPNVKIPDTT